MDTAWDVFSDFLYLAHSSTGLRLYNFVLMPNHFHLVCLDPEMRLSQGMALVMRESSREMGRLAGRINSIWGNRFHSSILEQPISFFRAYKYVYRNPVAAGLSSTVETYRWSTLQQLLGIRNGSLPLEEDTTLFSGVEETLAWLNQSYTQKEVEDLQAGFKRKNTKFPRFNSGPNPLYNWDSLPVAVSPKNVPGTF